MTITFDIEDTVRFHRPPVGEDRTRILSAYSTKDIPRRPHATGEQPLYAPRTIGIVDKPEYAGRHRLPEPAEVVPAPAAAVPSPVRRLIARLGRIGG